jgi:hypothetical protein
MSAVEFEKALHAALAGNAAVAAIVGTRIYPLMLPEGTPLPAVTYHRISGVPANSLTGHSGLEAVTVQVDGWARGFAEAKNLAASIRLAMAGAPFVNILDEDRDLYAPDMNTFRVSADYRCWHKE